MHPALNFDQIMYLKDVLGLDRVLFSAPMDVAAMAGDEADVPAERISEVSGILASARLVALVPLAREEFPLRGETAELLERMLKAMKLDPHQVLQMSFIAGAANDDMQALIAAAGDRPVVLFGDIAELGARQGEWLNHGGARVMTTYHPRDLLTSTQNKRVAWQHLQEVMRVLS